MKQYKVKITDKALSNMENLYNYIAFGLESPENAIKQYNRIADAIEGLYLLPERIKIMENKKAKALKLRRLLVDNYSVIFRINGDCVIIETVLCNASNIEERLL